MTKTLAWRAHFKDLTSLRIPHQLAFALMDGDPSAKQWLNRLAPDRAISYIDCEDETNCNILYT